MRLSTRKILDRSFTGAGLLSLALMCAALVVLLIPIFAGGMRAVIFRETIENRRYTLNEFERGNREDIETQIERARQARLPVYEMIEEFEESRWERLMEMARENDAPAHAIEMLEQREGALTSAIDRYEMAMVWAGKEPGAGLDELRKTYDILEPVTKAIHDLLGPTPGKKMRALKADQYGATRWSLAQQKRENLLYRVEYKDVKGSEQRERVLVPRAQEFAGTPLANLFPYVEEHLDEMLLPRWTFYWRFWFDRASPFYQFGGIWTEVLGTLYLTVGAMLIAAPVGVITAIYLAEYAGDSRLVSLIRICISTLAGVPSVVFGLFGVIFFIRTIGVSDSKSVAVGALVLALLVLPTIIRASEEAIIAVPHTFKEASLSLGASRWRCIVGVILPAAIPGIITSIIISMGRAAGETAPILFTAAVAAGNPVKLTEVFSKGTPALPANIYSIVAEHEALEEIIHVPYGMVMTLVSLVLLLNLVAIILRARISRKLRG